MALKVRALISPQHPIQRIKISANAALLKTELLAKNEHNIIKISITQLDKQANCVMIHFKLEDAVTPQELGIGDDT